MLGAWEGWEESPAVLSIWKPGEALPTLARKRGADGCSAHCSLSVPLGLLLFKCLRSRGVVCEKTGMVKTICPFSKTGRKKWIWGNTGFTVAPHLNSGIDYFLEVCEPLSKNNVVFHEKMCNIFSYERNANQNYNEISLHTSQNGCHEKNLQTTIAGVGVEGREPCYTVGGNVNQYSHCGEHYGGSLKN